MPLERTGLAALLGAAVVTIVVLWPPSEGLQQEEGIVQADALAAPPAPATSTGPEAGSVGSEEIDPFYPRRPTAVPAVPAVAEAPPPPAPTAPPFAYRVMGRVAAPGHAAEGDAAPPLGIYLERGEQLVKAEVGAELEDGYRVQSISADGIVVTHPLLQAPINIMTAPLAQTE